MRKSIKSINEVFGYHACECHASHVITTNYMVIALDFWEVAVRYISENLKKGILFRYIYLFGKYPG